MYIRWPATPNQPPLAATKVTILLSRENNKANGRGNNEWNANAFSGSVLLFRSNWLLDFPDLSVIVLGQIDFWEGRHFLEPPRPLRVWVRSNLFAEGGMDRKAKWWDQVVDRIVQTSPQRSTSKLPEFSDAPNHPPPTTPKFGTLWTSCF